MDATHQRGWDERALDDGSVAEVVARLHSAMIDSCAPPDRCAEALGYVLCEMAVRYGVTTRNLCSRVTDMHRSIRLAARSQQ